MYYFESHATHRRLFFQLLTLITGYQREKYSRQRGTHRTPVVLLLIIHYYYCDNYSAGQATRHNMCTTKSTEYCIWNYPLMGHRYAVDRRQTLVLMVVLYGVYAPPRPRSQWTGKKIIV